MTTEDIVRDWLRRLTGGGGIAALVSASAMAAVITAGLPPAATGTPHTAPAAAPAAKRSGKVLRAPDGKPDLHGTWSFASLIPFERPAEFGNKAVLTDAEAAAYAKNKVEQANKDRRDGSAAADVERAYNDFWWDFGTKASNRTSLIVDPPDGRLPARTAEAQLRLKNRRVSYENPEDRPLAERCILGFNSGPPMMPSAYNNNVEIVQTKDHVVLVNEMIHSARVVRINGSHPPSSFRFLTGDSIGTWEGDTLVVDTTNFDKEGMIAGATRDLHLVERFTLTDQDTLEYAFTVNDPATFTRSWTASVPMARIDELVYEYACHEGNEGMIGILRGARYEEKNPRKEGPK
jgi:hypothetical protein